MNAWNLFAAWGWSALYAAALCACPWPALGQASSAPASERTDRFDVKVKLLQEAWQRQDFALARALTHSLRDTVLQTEIDRADLGPPLWPAAAGRTRDALPESWQPWVAGWSHFQTVQVRETQGIPRAAEPIELVVAVEASQVLSLRRELRVARVVAGTLEEVPSQVLEEIRRGTERVGRVLFLGRAAANETATYLLIYGNPAAERPGYPSDLTTRGEGFALEIENEYFKAKLSRQNGQLERLTLKREHGLELFSGGEGHGEPPAIDWAHDYVDADGFQKFRMSLWDTCPDYEVIRGPLCTIIRRWGFPRSPVHPVFAPSRLHISVEYRFYASLPWFQKVGSMQAVQAFTAQALRDEEWVFSGRSFSERLWLDARGRGHVGEVPAEQREDLWGVGFFHPQSRDAFIALFLDHAATGLGELRHSGSPNLEYRWHGQLWSRYPLPGKEVPAGAVLRQNNVYVTSPYTGPETLPHIEQLYQSLRHPLQVTPAPWPQGASSARAVIGRLARPGEDGATRIAKPAVWAALRDCKDAQLYTADVNIVDLGLVEDIAVRGDTVTVVMVMPHRGRPLAGYFAQGSIEVHPTPSKPIIERLKQVPGVGKVVVEQTWEPPWNTHRLTEEGRRRLGLAPLTP